MKPELTAKELQYKLKEIVYKELNDLPAQLEALPPAERVRAIIHLLPYVSPKVQTCSITYADGNMLGW